MNAQRQAAESGFAGMASPVRTGSDIRIRRQMGLAGAAALAFLVLGLSGCAAAGPAAEGQQPIPAKSSSGESAAGPARAWIPEADAVQTQLEALAAQAPSPSRNAVREAYAAAGFSPDAVEVSQDITPTGLAVDSIVAGAPVAGQCVLGEVRSGSATVTVVPALSSGQCLIGDDR
ncbi:hypothetical protein H9638_06280 [Arthrobacter sp. Sa2BUA2]|uniref:DUF6993 domain-containing protein n=1 Tax=Arthrobacter pullicola TaxID=2762224 RepID=A0ABR8YH11_9MICC|nr:hypothetical protein [Arthrobacter pullicola]MBD8043418.1 hypothetical protein [Arthrobacter pullicola]